MLFVKPQTRDEKRRMLGPYEEGGAYRDADQRQRGDRAPAAGHAENRDTCDIM